MGRFTQAISEGDGISIVPLLDGDVDALASEAEAAGAEAVAVRTAADAERARAGTSLPILVREPDLRYDPDTGVLGRFEADACILVYERFASYRNFDQLHSSLTERHVDCAVDVRDEYELEEALARLDPEIILVSERHDEVEEQLERALDLLADVPAGKLVIAESGVLVREQVLALERAGVDAVLVQNLAGPQFSRAVEELVGGRRPGG